MKPGWKTTEGLLALLAVLIGAFMASGLVEPGSTAMRVAGIALVGLASMGYSVSRGMAKINADQWTDPAATSEPAKVDSAKADSEPPHA